MTLPLEGWSYSNGALRDAAGLLIVEIDPAENPALHDKLMRLGSILAPPVVNTTTVTVDGQVYTLKSEDDRDDVKALAATIVVDLRAVNLTLAQAKAIVAAIFRALRWYRKRA